MAQATDYNLANQTGADFRAELNEILAASVSLNSGSSEPTTNVCPSIMGRYIK